jgi:hypothetical protein
MSIFKTLFSQRMIDKKLRRNFFCCLNEISLIMVLDRLGLLKHFATVVAEYPSAAQSVYEVIIAVMKMRTEEFVKADFEDFTARTFNESIRLQKRLRISRESRKVDWDYSSTTKSFQRNY